MRPTGLNESLSECLSFLPIIPTSCVKGMWGWDQDQPAPLGMMATAPQPQPAATHLSAAVSSLLELILRSIRPSFSISFSILLLSSAFMSTLAVGGDSLLSLVLPISLSISPSLSFSPALSLLGSVPFTLFSLSLSRIFLCLPGKADVASSSPLVRGSGASGAGEVRLSSGSWRGLAALVGGEGGRNGRRKGWASCGQGGMG